MKVLTKVTEIEGEGLPSLLGKKVMLRTVGFTYSGVLIGVGAAFDFHSGRVRQAPRWLRRCGLEWLFRFATEPRRLGARYLRTNPRFILHVLAQRTGLRRYPLD